jgi:hypothetical protein
VGYQSGAIYNDLHVRYQLEPPIDRDAAALGIEHERRPPPARRAVSALPRLRGRAGDPQASRKRSHARLGCDHVQKLCCG